MREAVMAALIIMIVGYAMLWALIKLIISEIFNGKVRVINADTERVKACENALRFTKKD